MWISRVLSRWTPQNTETHPDSAAVVKRSCQMHVLPVRCPESFFHRPVVWWLKAGENIFHTPNKESLQLYYYFFEWALPKFVDHNQYFQSEKVVIISLRSKMCGAFRDILLTFKKINCSTHATESYQFQWWLKHYTTPHDIPGCKSDAASLAAKYSLQPLTEFSSCCMQLRRCFDFDDSLVT